MTIMSITDISVCVSVCVCVYLQIMDLTKTNKLYKVIHQCVVYLQTKDKWDKMLFN